MAENIAEVLSILIVSPIAWSMVSGWRVQCSIIMTSIHPADDEKLQFFGFNGTLTKKPGD